MNCYLCAQENKETPALAVCLTCGMGVCQEHLVRDSITIEDVTTTAFNVEKVIRAQNLPRILCKPCHAAFNE